MAKLKKEDYLKFTKNRLAELLVENNKSKLTKEDYMRLSRERLAELLVEFDNEPTVDWWIKPDPNTLPYKPWTAPYEPWSDGTDISGLPDCCKPGGNCTNPQMDCINCPRRTYVYGYNTSSTAKTPMEKIVEGTKTRAEFNTPKDESVEQK